MAVDYQAPTKDMAFLIKHVVDLPTITALPGYEECSEDVIDAILDEAGKFANGVISPLNTVSDNKPPALSNDHRMLKLAGTAYQAAPNSKAKAFLSF